ncbi:MULTISPECIES: hypothetical protein [unclassified Pseudomonas]|uniref:hypothetical protein n=1 Tax=unclassified Pseudomonas TaxID=196821 RepID=UPI0015A0EB7E|nr:MULTISPECIES: hypothetical protein [unclassified Pseudomonas]NWC95267.1 hypothetical protein [Pseudomonas sp. IPO3779]NWD17133.1 hypothetical protein [Pseudomonas sp. IPO3778]
MKYQLDGKKVLLIAPQFFGYEVEIRSELERRGAKVSFLLDRPFSSPFMKAITRLRREWVINAADRYYTQQVSSFDSNDFDYVFVVNGQTLSTGILDVWKRSFSNAIFILYMWDSFGNRRWGVDNLPFFDHVFTFDRNDAKKYALNFRPLFFSSGFEKKPLEENTYDVSFIGTAHTDRYQVLTKVDRALGPGVHAYWYLFLQAKWVYWAYKLTNKGFRLSTLSDFKFAPLNKATVQGVFFQSKAILDIEHPQQTGLTMRTLETLGARKKLITTNISVREYDFYSDNNICIVDRNAPVIPPGFLAAAYTDVAPEVYARYRLEGWLDEILEVASA